MARPSKYTPERVEKLTTALALGATHRLACQYAGVSEASFERWRKSKAGFAEALREAEARGAIGWLAKIEAAANAGDWRPAAWKLSHRYPEAYGRKVQDTKPGVDDAFNEALRTLARSWAEAERMNGRRP
jgi:hypothetical protein